MRAMWFVLLSVFSFSAFAEESAWVQADTDARRFLGENTPGPRFTAGSKVTVLKRDGESVRIFAGDRFGWVPAAALSATDPKAAAEPAPPPIQIIPQGE